MRTQLPANDRDARQVSELETAALEPNSPPVEDCSVCEQKLELTSAAEAAVQETNRSPVEACALQTAGDQRPKLRTAKTVQRANGSGKTEAAMEGISSTAGSQLMAHAGTARRRIDFPIDVFRAACSEPTPGQPKLTTTSSAASFFTGKSCAAGMGLPRLTTILLFAHRRGKNGDPVCYRMRRIIMMRLLRSRLPRFSVSTRSSLTTAICHTALQIFVQD
jgi:hypothetical protein